MNLSVDDTGDTVMIVIGESRLDAAIAGVFKDRLRPHVAADGPHIVLDLAQVDFLDSSGLGALVALHKALPQGRRLRLTGLTPNVDRVFRLTCMDRVLDIEPAKADGDS